MSVVLTNPIFQGNTAPSNRAAVVCATLVAGTLATSFAAGQVVDGVTLVVGQRILIKNQVATTDNGIYYVSSTVPVRTEDMPVGLAATGLNIFVQTGSQANTAWVCTSSPAVVGTNSIIFAEYDVTSTLAVARGGTGVTSFGGTNTVLYTTTTGALSAIPTATNAFLVTNGSGVPSITSTLPSNLALVSPFLTTPNIYGLNATNYYTLQPGTITSNIMLSLPTTASNQTFMFAALQQVVTNKNLIDASVVFNNASDTSKTLQFDLSTVPSLSTITLQVPTASGIIATQQYAQGLVNGLDWKQSVRAKTTAMLNVTPSGSQTTKLLTSNVNGAISTFASSFDGVALGLSDRILVDNTAFGGANLSCGIYVVQTVGSGSAPYVLARALDADISSEVSTGMAMYIQEGSSWAGTQWTLVTYMPIVLDVTALSFTQFGGFVGAAGGALTGSYPNPQINSNSTVGQPLLSSGTVGVAAGFGALPLGGTSTVSGTLPIGNGGIGASSALISQIPVATSTTAAAWQPPNNKSPVVSASASILALESSISGAPAYTATAGPTSTGQITATLATTGVFILDGITQVAGNRVLLKDEAASGGMGGAANGIWIVGIAGTALTLNRATDFDLAAKIAPDSLFFVEQGNTNALMGYVFANVAPYTIGGASGSILVFTSLRTVISDSPFDIVFWGLNNDNPTYYRVMDRAGRILVSSDFSTLLSNVFGAIAVTTIAAGSNGQTLPQATINVASTSGFLLAGTITIGASTVTYTGITSTTFTGCTGGSTLMTTGEAVSKPLTNAWIPSYYANGSTVSTTISSLSNGQVLPQSTINVASTAGIVAPGNVIIGSLNNVTFSDITSTTLTGCTGGTGTLATGESVSYTLNTYGVSVKFTGGKYYYATQWTLSFLNNILLDFGLGTFTPMNPGLNFVQWYDSNNIMLRGGYFQCNGSLFPSTVTIYPITNVGILSLCTTHSFNFCSNIIVTEQFWQTINSMGLSNCSNVVISNIIGDTNQGMITAGTYVSVNPPFTSSNRILIKNVVGTNQLDDMIQFGWGGGSPGAICEGVNIVGCSCTPQYAHSNPANLSAWGSPTLCKIGDAGMTIQDFLIDSCESNGQVCGWAIKVRGTIVNVCISNCLFNNIANTQYTKTSTAPLSAPLCAAIYCNTATVANADDLIIKNNQFNNVAIAVNLAGNPATVFNNTISNPPSPIYNANWNLPYFSANIGGGTPTDATLIGLGNMLGDGIVRGSTTSHGNANTLYTNTVANQTTINAPPSLTQNGQFSVNAIVVGQPVVDQSVPASSSNINFNSFWQAFTPINTGNWTVTTIQVSNNESWTLQLSAYIGQGVGGTLIQQQSFAMSAHVSPVTTTLTWTTPIAVTAETLYTFQASNITDGSNMTLRLEASANFPYGRGLSQLGNSALQFSITIVPSTTGRQQLQMLNASVGTTTSEIRNECSDQFSAAVTTPNATPVTLFSYNFASRTNEIVQLSASISGLDSANNCICVSYTNGCLKNKAGVVTLTAPSLTTIVSDNVAFSTSVSLVSTTLTIQVTGSTNVMNWRGAIFFNTPAQVFLY